MKIFFAILCPSIFGAFFRLNFGGTGGSTRSDTTTTNTDKRLAVGDGGAGISGDGSSIVITDSGIVSRALDSVDSASAVQAGTFDKLLDISQQLIGTTQKSVADAYQQANTDAKGTIDNKTIIVLGVAAAAAIAFTKGKK